MANLSSFKRNSVAFLEGAWKRPDPERPEFRILTRGFTDRYHDLQSAKQRKAAKSFGGDVNKLPVATTRHINIECLIAECLIGVELKDDDDHPVTFEEFCEALQDPDQVDLQNSAFTAAGMVTNERAADTKEAAGN